MAVSPFYRFGPGIPGSRSLPGEKMARLNFPHPQKQSFLLKNFVFTDISQDY